MKKANTITLSTHKKKRCFILFIIKAQQKNPPALAANKIGRLCPFYVIAQRLSNSDSFGAISGFLL